MDACDQRIGGNNDLVAACRPQQARIVDKSKAARPRDRREITRDEGEFADPFQVTTPLRPDV